MARLRSTLRTWSAQSGRNFRLADGCTTKDGVSRAVTLKSWVNLSEDALGSIALLELAEFLGAKGVTATTPETIALELQRGLSMNEVTVMHVPIIGGNP